MSADRELLEKAARAVGLVGKWSKTIGGWDCLVINGQTANPWQPLHDDGDALRLAVQLNLTIQRPWLDDERTDMREVRVWSAEPDYVYESLVGVDPYAATRRAIVRAAAAIGGGHER